MVKCIYEIPSHQEYAILFYCKHSLRVPRKFYLAMSMSARLAWLRSLICSDCESEFAAMQTAMDTWYRNYVKEKK
jgi:hypothetical protein